MPSPETVPAVDLVVWDLHGELTTAVRREIRDGVRFSAHKFDSVSGEWRGRRVAVAWPKRLTASQLPTIREVFAGLLAAHRPSRSAIIGPAARGESRCQVGQVVDLAAEPGVATRWAAKAHEALHQLGADAVLLAAITHDKKNAPPATRPTAARQAGRWIGTLFGGVSENQGIDTSGGVAKALSALLEEPQPPISNP